MRACARTRGLAHTDARRRTQARARAHARTHAHVHVRARARTLVHAYACAHRRGSRPCARAQRRARARAHACGRAVACEPFPSLCGRSGLACAFMHACMCMCVRVCACVCLCVCVRAACVSVCVFSCALSGLHKYAQVCIKIWDDEIEESFQKGKSCRMLMRQSCVWHFCAWCIIALRISSRGS